MGAFKGFLWGFYKGLGFRAIWGPLKGFCGVSISV